MIFYVILTQYFTSITILYFISTNMSYLKKIKCNFAFDSMKYYSHIFNYMYFNKSTMNCRIELVIYFVM